MTQPTTQKTGDANCRKIDDGNLNNSANTEIYAYSETTFGGSTIGCVMTENSIYGCCDICEDVSDSHLGHTEMDTKKQFSESVLWTILKHYWNEFQ